MVFKLTVPDLYSLHGKLVLLNCELVILFSLEFWFLTA